MISVKHAPMSSRELYERLLRDYHLQMEMLAGTYVLAMTTVGDTQEGLDRLRDALLAIDAEIDTKLKSGSGQEECRAGAETDANDRHGSPAFRKTAVTGKGVDDREGSEVQR